MRGFAELCVPCAERGIRRQKVFGEMHFLRKKSEPAANTYERQADPPSQIMLSVFRGGLPDAGGADPQDGFSACGYFFRFPV